MKAGKAEPVLELVVCNESCRKRLYRTDALRSLAERICAGEGVTGAVELSVLFCDDPCITRLNREYRKLNRPTDVLSFSQKPIADGGPRILGDIVISLETVERHCRGDRAAMREEVRLLFCHGLLHLLNYTHASAKARGVMAGKQADYLDIPLNSAWLEAPKKGAANRK